MIKNVSKYLVYLELLLLSIAIIVSVFWVIDPDSDLEPIIVLLTILLVALETVRRLNKGVISSKNKEEQIFINRLEELESELIKIETNKDLEPEKLRLFNTQTLDIIAVVYEDISNEVKSNQSDKSTVESNIKYLHEGLENALARAVQRSKASKNKKFTIRRIIKEIKPIFAFPALIIVVILLYLWQSHRSNLSECAENNLQVYNFSKTDDLQFSKKLYNKLKTNSDLRDLIEVDYIDRNVINDDEFICLESGVRVYGDLRADVGNFQCVVEVLNMYKCNSQLLADTLILIEEPNQFTIDMVNSTTDDVYSLLMGIMFYYNCNNSQAISTLTNLLRIGKFHGKNRDIAYLFLANALLRQGSYLTAIRTYDLISTEQTQDYTGAVLSNRKLAEETYEESLSNIDKNFYYCLLSDNEINEFVDLLFNVLEVNEYYKESRTSQNIGSDSTLFIDYYSTIGEYSAEDIPIAGSIISRNTRARSLSTLIDHKPINLEEITIPLTLGSLDRFLEKYFFIEPNRLYFQTLTEEMKESLLHKSTFFARRTTLSEEDYASAKNVLIKKDSLTDSKSQYHLVTEAISIEKLRITNHKFIPRKEAKWLDNFNAPVNLPGKKEINSFTLRDKDRVYQYIQKEEKVLSNGTVSIVIVEFAKSNSDDNKSKLFEWVYDIHFSPPLTFIQSVVLDESALTKSDTEY